MAKKKININRAPVLTLWAIVVAERLGYDKETALTLGKAVAGLNAQSKGRSLGIYKKKSEEKPKEENLALTKVEGMKEKFIELMGRGVPALQTTNGLRAVIKSEEIDPRSVEKYLQKKFGVDLDDATHAMEKLAKTFTPKQLEGKAYGLYEKFRPEIPVGAKGWGAKGELDLEYIISLTK